MNLSDLFGPRVYASKRNEAISVLPDVVLEEGARDVVGKAELPIKVLVLSSESCVVTTVFIRPVVVDTDAPVDFSPVHDSEALSLEEPQSIRGIVVAKMIKRRGMKDAKSLGTIRPLISWNASTVFEYQTLSLDFISLGCDFSCGSLDRLEAARQARLRFS